MQAKHSCTSQAWQHMVIIPVPVMQRQEDPQSLLTRQPSLPCKFQTCVRPSPIKKSGWAYGMLPKVYAHACMCTHTYACTCIYTHICTCVYAHTCRCVYIHMHALYIYTHVHESVCGHTCTCVHTCMNLCTHTCTCVHTHLNADPTKSPSAFFLVVPGQLLLQNQ